MRACGSRRSQGQHRLPMPASLATATESVHQAILFSFPPPRRFGFGSPTYFSDSLDSIGGPAVQLQFPGGVGDRRKGAILAIQGKRVLMLRGSLGARGVVRRGRGQ